MSNCPLFVAVENARRNNCGECVHWDKERQKCRDEEKLKELGAT